MTDTSYLDCFFLSFLVLTKWTASFYNTDHWPMKFRTLVFSIAFFFKIFYSETEKIRFSEPKNPKQFFAINYLSPSSRKKRSQCFIFCSPPFFSAAVKMQNTKLIRNSKSFIILRAVLKIQIFIPPRSLSKTCLHLKLGFYQDIDSFIDLFFGQLPGCGFESREASWISFPSQCRTKS